MSFNRWTWKRTRLRTIARCSVYVSLNAARESCPMRNLSTRRHKWLPARMRCRAVEFCGEGARHCFAHSKTLSPLQLSSASDRCLILPLTHKFQYSPSRSRFFIFGLCAFATTFGVFSHTTACAFLTVADGGPQLGLVWNGQVGILL